MRNRTFWKRALHLLGSFTFGFQAQRFVHELGHALVAWMAGGVVYSIDIHPLLTGHCRSSPIPYPGVKAWAGSVFSVGFGVLLLVVLWRLGALKASWAPVGMIGIAAMLVNGVYLIVGTMLRVGDAGYLVYKIGTSPALIVAVGTLMLVCGIVAMVAAQGALFGIGRDESIAERAALFGVGVLPHWAIALLYREAFNTGGSRDAAAYLAIAGVLVLLVAVVSRVLPSSIAWFPGSRETALLTWRQPIAAVTSAVLIMAVQLLFFT